jgi:hypothetical protein
MKSANPYNRSPNMPTSRRSRKIQLSRCTQNPDYGSRVSNASPVFQYKDVVLKSRTAARKSGTNFRLKFVRDCERPTHRSHCGLQVLPLDDPRSRFHKQVSGVLIASPMYPCSGHRPNP